MLKSESYQIMMIVTLENGVFLFNFIFIIVEYHAIFKYFHWKRVKIRKENFVKPPQIQQPFCAASPSMFVFCNFEEIWKIIVQFFIPFFFLFFIWVPPCELLKLTKPLEKHKLLD